MTYPMSTPLPWHAGMDSGYPPCEQPEVEARHLAYRSHWIRPADGVALTEFLIEEQLTAAHDEGVPITVFGLMIDQRLANEIEALFDMADEVRDAENHGPTSRYYASADAYCDQLRVLARMVSK